MNDSTVKDFVKAIRSEKKNPSPYDTTAKVTRVEGNTAWVHISGGVDETPVRMTVNAEVGDEVQVRVGGGKAWITGNATAPPTDDKTALLARIEGIEAKQKAREAAAKADVANDKADTATQYASDALDAASGSLVTDTLHYLATSLSSGVTIHTAGWTTTPQTISENNPYLWTYHTYTKASGTQTNTTPVIIGTYGKDGTSVTILGSYNTLAELEAAHPTGSIGDSYMVSGDLYVWNGSAWENVGRIQGPQGNPGQPGQPGDPGQKGDDGVSITAVQPQYYLSTSSSSATGGSWSNSLTYVSGKYIWTREKISYSNNTTGYSTAIYNQALTQACSDAMQALEVAQEVKQYMWHTETDTGTGAGTHITAIPQDEFLADPANGGYNSLFDNIGMKIRNGLRTLASYGTSMIIGEENSARVEIDSDTVRSITEDGVEAFSIETSAQESPQNVTKTLENKVPKNSTQTITLSDLSTGVAGTTISLSYSYYYYYEGMAYGPAKGAIAVRDFTKGTASTYTGTYTENATGTSVTRTYTIAYDGVNSFTITNPSPYFTFDLTRIKFTSQSAPTPETNFNGLFKLNGINFEQPTLDNTTLTPYSSRCYIRDGGIFKFGKWRFIQVNVEIRSSLGANNTWAIMDGLSSDLPATKGMLSDASLGYMTSLSACVRGNYGNISAYITDAGRIAIATAGQSLGVNSVVMISGMYIAQ